MRRVSKTVLCQKPPAGSVTILHYQYRCGAYARTPQSWTVPPPDQALRSWRRAVSIIAEALLIIPSYTPAMRATS